MMLYQQMAGPLASAVRISNKVAADSQMQAVSRIVLLDATNQAASGDCDGDGSIEPREWRAGAAAPTNGGLIPLTVGAPVTDPWGTDYGYCVWDVGSYNDPVNGGGHGCGDNAKRLMGTPTPSAGNANIQTVVAVISAGPDRHFDTTCYNYAATVTDPTKQSDTNLVQTASGKDDIVKKFTYNEAAQSTGLWSIKVGAPATTTIAKNVEVTDPGGGTGGIISAVAANTTGKMIAGGGVQPGDLGATSCNAGNKALIMYDTTGTGSLKFCNSATPTPAWTSIGGGDMSTPLSQGLTCDASLKGRLQYDPTNPGVVQYCNNAGTWTTVGAGGGGGAAMGSATVATAETTTAAVYGDLTTAGPAVTLTTGTGAFVTLTARIFNSNAASECAMGFAITGGAAAASTQALTYRASTATNEIIQASATFYVSGLTAGSNTFTAKYAMIAGSNGTRTCTFANRGISVVGTSAVTACSDTTPGSLSFTNASNVATTTLTASNIVQITGFDCTTNTSISGSGGAQYRICNDAACAGWSQDWTSAASSIAPNQYMQLRLTSSSSAATDTTATITAGGAGTTWHVSTANDCPNVGDSCADGSVYAGLSSAPGTPRMYATACDAGRTGTKGACSGGRGTYTWNNGTGNWYDTSGPCTISANDGLFVAPCIAGITGSGNGAPHAAAKFCNDLVMHGRDDWFLPSQSELNTLRANRAAIGDFRSDTVPDAENWYWSSTELNGSGAWGQRLSDGTQDYDNKNSVLYVRCVR